jgi:general secretion pathway protein L
MSADFLFRLVEQYNQSEEQPNNQIDRQIYEWLDNDQRVYRGSAAELAAAAAGRRPLLVARGEYITLSAAKVPGRNRNTWLKALPYALEEYLADDVEKLHFAPGEPTPTGDIPVAVVQHQLLSGWLASCAQAGVEPVAVIPDYLLLPLSTAGSWSLLLEDDRASVRSGPWSGFSCEVQLLPLVLTRALAGTAAGPPPGLQLWATDTVAADVVAGSLPLPLQHADNAATPLQVFADGYRHSAVINLLQGRYGYQSQWRQQLRPWKMAAILAGLWCGSQLLGQGIEYGQLKREQTQLQQAMIETLREAVPGVRRIVNPQAQLENRLQELQRHDANGVTAFFELLRHGGRSLVDFQNVTLRGLRYKDNQLDLELEGDNLAVFDQLKQQLSNQTGLRVEMRVSKRENRVESRLTLNKG